MDKIDLTNHDPRCHSCRELGNESICHSCPVKYQWSLIKGQERSRDPYCKPCLIVERPDLYRSLALEEHCAQCRERRGKKFSTLCEDLHRVLAELETDSNV